MPRAIAIIDLSNKVFSPRMTNMALSRVRSLDGVHLIDFDPASIIVSTNCLKEINRLCAIYRKDLLLLYMMFLKPKTPVKKTVYY